MNQSLNPPPPDTTLISLVGAILSLVVIAIAIWALAWGVAHLMAWVVNKMRDHRPDQP